MKRRNIGDLTFYASLHFFFLCLSLASLIPPSCLPHTFSPLTFLPFPTSLPPSFPPSPPPLLTTVLPACSQTGLQPHHWRRVWVKGREHNQQVCQASSLGHGWPGAVPLSDSQLLPRSCRRSAGLRHIEVTQSYYYNFTKLVCHDVDGYNAGCIGWYAYIRATLRECTEIK